MCGTDTAYVGNFMVISFLFCDLNGLGAHSILVL